MGRFFIEDDIAKSNNISHNNSNELDWLVGHHTKNFVHSLNWYENNYINFNRRIREIPQVKVRRWCERNLEGDILAIKKSETEFIYKVKEKPWQGGYQHSTYWVEFELESDMIAFKLKWL